MTSFHANKAIAGRLKSIQNQRGPEGEYELKASVKNLKKVIEDDPDLYMGFIQMFSEAPDSVVGATMSVYIIVLMVF